MTRRVPSSHQDLRHAMLASFVTAPPPPPPPLPLPLTSPSHFTRNGRDWFYLKKLSIHALSAFLSAENRDKWDIKFQASFFFFLFSSGVHASNNDSVFVLIFVVIHFQTLERIVSHLKTEPLTLVMLIDLVGRVSACFWVSVREEQIKVVAATSGIALILVTTFRSVV